MRKDSKTDIKNEPNLADVHVIKAQQLLNYIIQILRHFGPNKDQLHAYGFEGKIGSCILDAKKMVSNLGWDYEYDTARLAALIEGLNQAEGYARGDDLDTVTARHLRPLIDQARQLADRLKEAHDISTKQLEDLVSDYSSNVSTYPYFEIILCHSITHRIKALLNNHYGSFYKKKQLSTPSKKIISGEVSQIFQSPIFVLVLLILLVSSIAIWQSWEFYSDKSFIMNLLSELHGLVAELFLVGVIITLLQRRAREKDKYQEEVLYILKELYEMRSYPGDDSIREKARLIRRLTRLRKTANINLEGMKLQGADLAGCYLHGANLDGATLDGANLSNADLSHAKMRNARLVGCNLSLTDIDSVDFQGTDLSNCNMISTRNLLKAKGLSYAKLSGTKIHPILKGILFKIEKNNIHWCTKADDLKDESKDP